MAWYQTVSFIFYSGFPRSCTHLTGNPDGYSRKSKMPFILPKTSCPPLKTKCKSFFLVLTDFPRRRRPALPESAGARGGPRGLARDWGPPGVRAGQARGGPAGALVPPRKGGQSLPCYSAGLRSLFSRRTAPFQALERLGSRPRPSDGPAARAGGQNRGQGPGFGARTARPRGGARLTFHQPGGRGR